MAETAFATARAVSRAQAKTLPKPALPGVPAHVGTMLGLSVAGYGIALAVVTGLQASAEGAVAQDRAPIAATIDDIAARHDGLGQTLDQAAGRYTGMASGYQSVADRLAIVEDRLAALASSVAKVDGATRALPASVPLPPVVRAVRVSTPRSTTHATSGGSAP